MSYPFLPTLVETSRARRRMLAAAATAETRRAADAVIANALSSALEPETRYIVTRHFARGDSAYAAERYAVREIGSGADPVDVFRTHSGALHAARMLDIGTCHVEPHRPLGTRIQPN